MLQSGNWRNRTVPNAQPKKFTRSTDSIDLSDLKMKTFKIAKAEKADQRKWHAMSASD